MFEFYAGTSDAEFLFKAAVVDYLLEIRHRALDMRTHQQIYERMPVGDERSRDVQAVEAAHNQLLWFGEQITAMTKVFAPYLDFSRIKLSAFPLFRSSR